MRTWLPLPGRVHRALPHLVATLAIALAACSDAPSAPVATGPGAPADLRMEVVDPVVPAGGMTRSIPLQHDITVTARIGRRGGTLSIPEAGLRVIVPPGAVAGDVTFTATALKGALVAYDFGPHGTRFATPLRVSQELRGTDWRRIPRGHLEAGYFASRTQIDAENNLVQINEFLPLDVDMTGQKMRFDVEHFSGYIITTGRNPQPQNP